MNKGHEAEITQFLFAAVCNGYFGRTLECDLTLIGPEHVSRKILDQTTAFHTPNRCTPTVALECAGQPGCESEGRVAPQVAGVIRAVDILDEVEPLSDESIHRAVRQAPEKPWQGESDVA